MPRITVFHDYYGCATGCCGHSVEMDGRPGKFDFSHYRGSTEEERKAFIRKLVTQAYGEEPCKDIDWDNCVVTGWDNC